MIVAFTLQRDVVAVAGPDAETYLHSQLSQDIIGLPIGAVVASLVLEPTGRVDALVRVTRIAPEVFEVDIDAGFGEQLMARLKRFKIRVNVEMELVTRSCVAIRGKGADALGVVGDVRPAWWMDGDAIDVFGAAVLPDIKQVSGDAVQEVRLSAGWPAMGSEITPDALPAELGVTSIAVSFKKGCYPGQELVERMDSRGAQAPRTLCKVPSNISASDIEITSVAGSAALAYVKRGIELASIGATPVGPSGN